MTPPAIPASHDLGSWVNGLAEWTEGDTAFLSIAFTWRLDDACMRAQWYRAQGLGECPWEIPCWT